MSIWDGYTSIWSNRKSIWGDPAALSVSFEELAGSPTVSRDMYTMVITRRLKCLWEDVDLLCRELLGQGATLTAPHVFPTAQYCVCTSADYEPFGKCIGQRHYGGSTPTYKEADYEHAIITAGYEVPDFYITSTNLYIEEWFESSAEFLTLPDLELYWAADKTEPLDTTEGPGILVPTLEWHLIYHHVWELPTSILDAVGQVQNTEIISYVTGRTFAANTLLYNPPTFRPQVRGDGLPVWEIEYRLTHRATEWNKFYKRADETPRSIYDGDGTRIKPYTEADWWGDALP